jgi:thiamine kinase-like enzyme
MITQNRQQHLQEVHTFLQQHFSNQPWELTLPGGSGNETYFARCNEQRYFIKLGVQVKWYQVAASMGLTPQVLAAASLRDGTALIVQPYISGKSPAPRDYQNHLDLFASAINRLHHSAEVKGVLPAVPSNLYRAAGQAALAQLQQKWERYKAQVPGAADFVDNSLAQLSRQVADFQGAGLVASHNDICNANWLLTDGGQLFLIDLESMALDDPAVDLGATLWWYYPPHLRAEFLAKSGYIYDTELKKRMQVRLVMHCLNILLPREHGFQKFNPDSFSESLIDFRAVLAGRENPQGYDA